MHHIRLGMMRARFGHYRNLAIASGYVSKRNVNQ